MNDRPLDRRIHAYTPDLADERLRGRVEAERFVAGNLRRVRASATPLRMTDDPTAPYDTELLRGEVVRVYADTDHGSSWGQLETDGYVGFVATDALGSLEPEPNSRIVTLRTFVYPEPDMKTPPVMALSLGATIALESETTVVRDTSYRLLTDGSGNAVIADHVAPIDAEPAKDYVAVAEQFINVPYLWGGRTGLGIDCSALVQVTLMMAGVAAPRDSDLQCAKLGQPVDNGVGGQLHRGDLVFWPGHVAILTAPNRIVHASGHHMTVVTEPLTEAAARIARTTGPPTAIKRVSTPSVAE